MSKIRWWAITALLAASAPAFAFKPSDLDAARNLVAGADYIGALRILRPCLEGSAEQRIASAVLEQCLVLGDEAAVAAVRNGPERDSGEFAKSMRDVGVPVQTELYGHSYDHRYLARLQILFPKSKHADHAAFLVNPGSDHWENRVEHLEQYIAGYPKGIHVRSALLELAMIYDNAWDYTRPDSEDKQAAGFLGTDTGDPAANAKKAEAYWQKAILYYERMLAHPGDSRDADFRDHELERGRRRLPELRERKPSHFVVVHELID